MMSVRQWKVFSISQSVRPASFYYLVCGLGEVERPLEVRHEVTLIFTRDVKVDHPTFTPEMDPRRQAPSRLHSTTLHTHAWQSCNLHHTSCLRIGLVLKVSMPEDL